MRKTYIFLSGLVVLVTAFALLGQHEIFRYPRLTLDPLPRPDMLSLDSAMQLEAKGAYVKDEGAHRFRAFQPNVILAINSQGPVAEQTVHLENIHPESAFSVLEGKMEWIQEQSNNLERVINVSAIPAGARLVLSWKFPERKRYRFVAIGDTGGDLELDWGMRRAAELAADFILHLGDAYYDESESGNIAARMNESVIPVYVSNGNHDFLGPNKNAIDTFLKNIGPMNARFSMAGYCFINLDTGAYMYPAHKGERAGMLAAEVANHTREPTRCTEYIVFTHKPMVKKFEARFQQREHALHHSDARWMIDQLRKLGKVTVLAGHIHADFEFEQDGIKTFVTGSGLAHIDLTRGGHYAKVLVGEFGVGSGLKFDWALNQMPMNYHCSKKIYRALKQDKSPKARAVAEACGLNGEGSAE